MQLFALVFVEHGLVGVFHELFVLLSPLLSLAHLFHLKLVQSARLHLHLFAVELVKHPADLLVIELIAQLSGCNVVDVHHPDESWFVVEQKRDTLQIPASHSVVQSAVAKVVTFVDSAP